MNNSFWIQDNVEILPYDMRHGRYYCSFCGEPAVMENKKYWFCSCNGAKMFDKIRELKKELDQYTANHGTRVIKKRKLCIERVELYNKLNEIDKQLKD